MPILELRLVVRIAEIASVVAPRGKRLLQLRRLPCKALYLEQKRIVFGLDVAKLLDRS